MVKRRESPAIFTAFMIRLLLFIVHLKNSFDSILSPEMPVDSSRDSRCFCMSAFSDCNLETKGEILSVFISRYRAPPRKRIRKPKDIQKIPRFFPFVWSPAVSSQNSQRSLFFMICLLSYNWPNVRILAFGWISFWDMTTVWGRNRSTTERT